MELFLRLGRFLNILSAPIRNPYTLVASLLAITGMLTALRGPQHLVWGVILLWMAGMWRLHHSQRETLRAQVKLLESLEFSRMQLYSRSFEQERELL